MNGKGSRPRNNFSKNFRDNYSEINWSEKCSYCNGTGFIVAEKTECPACKGKKTLKKK